MLADMFWSLIAVVAGSAVSDGVALSSVGDAPWSVTAVTLAAVVAVAVVRHHPCRALSLTPAVVHADARLLRVRAAQVLPARLQCDTRGRPLPRAPTAVSAAA